ncbi:hypothetical protein [Leptolyngbya iicbica]|uniref:Uncharacterized protein n=2 Tax=Cyanophyceae TaxID=3028117 RepID=A0A4Q7EEV6_9CYAN|nr:hypothetical protein [Leptolyngbya sp. LK]RZM81765.1 hypothetical protein DYY88_00300 [Leptolyngbya sp. LK]
MPNRFELLFHPEDSLMPSDHLYARLELLQTEPHPTQSALADPPPRARWQRWGQALLNYFVGSTAPRITTHTTHQGQLCYRVYDPVDRRHYTFDSELEVRVWLEGRYYQ